MLEISSIKIEGNLTNKQRWQCRLLIAFAVRLTRFAKKQQLQPAGGINRNELI
jgi:hypothetical protein